MAIGAGVGGGIGGGSGSGSAEFGFGGSGGRVTGIKPNQIGRKISKPKHT
jgi:hypothetical protein